MRLSRYPLFTLKETPADAEIVSHQLMLRAGLIRKIASGLYSWMPMGLRVLNKVENIVREEMDKAGCIELQMPTVQPAELWKASGRLNAYGRELLRFTDRHERDFCYGPTHEEVITHHFGQEFRSYKQLPINLYQINTKFRDEIRPRFGVMRAREFLMKDGYSFHLDQDSLEQGYQNMRTAYSRVFDRCGVDYRIVQADSGQIGGSRSEEFHVIADAGEDLLAISDTGSYAANVEAAACSAQDQRPVPSAEMTVVGTPTQKTITEVSALLGTPASQCIKTLIVKGQEGLVALVLRGDHELNEVKAKHHPALADELMLASDAEVEAATGCKPGFVGPVGLDIPILADHAALQLADFTCGANQTGKHLTGVNWERDLPEAEAADLRMITEGENSPDGQGNIILKRGIEVGHIFQLGDKYTRAMNVSVLGENGQAQTPIMGTYGIGVSRVIGAAIEQCHDERGIIWPEAIAPFRLILVPINMHKSERLATAVETLYDELLHAGIDVVLDDRTLRPGVKFADAELIGIPHRVVIGERGLDAGTLEYRRRDEDDNREIAFSSQAILEAIQV